MIYINKELDICIENKKNYRAFLALNNEYILTIFPNKKIYFLDDNMSLKQIIDTEYFYGDIKPIDNDTFVCGCYSSLNTEIHIINRRGIVLKKYNYYKLMDKSDKDKEQFISFCHSCFIINDKIYFTLKHSENIYYIENNKVTSIDFKDIFNNNYTIECATFENKFLYCIINYNNDRYMVKFSNNKEQLYIHKINLNNLGEICNCYIQNRNFYIVNGEIENSKIKLIYSEI